MKRSRPRSRRHRGFTLIEVLLVLVILVILASLVTVNIISSQRSANLKAAKVQAEAIAVGVDSYHVGLQTFPSAATGLSALRTPPADLPDPSKWEGPYLSKEIPRDPWGKDYQYRCPGVHNPGGFDVYTTSPEGAEIGNWTD